MKLYVQEPCADIPENVIREALKVLLGNDPYLRTSHCVPSCDEAIEFVCDMQSESTKHHVYSLVLIRNTVCYLSRNLST